MSAGKWNHTSLSASRHSILVWAGLIVSGAALALDIDELIITKERGAYHVQMSFSTAAQPDRVIEVLIDYENPDRLFPDVKKREIISSEGGVTRVRTEVRSCLFFFCRDLEMIQDVTSTANTVQADIVPEGSDFRSGTMRWIVASTEDGTSHVTFESSMEPDVFIPPLLGKILIRRMLEQEVLAIATNLENEAAH